MPDMPQPGPQGGAPGGAPPPGAGGPPQGGGQGGGIADAIVQVDQTLNKITQAVAANPQVPKEVKDAASEALAAFRGFSQALVKAVGGQPAEDGDEPDGDEGGGATTPEQGGSGAQPLTHANVRGQ